MTLNFYLDNRSKQTDKNILLYIRGLGKTLKFNTKEKINPNDWDASKQKAKRTYTGHPELNSYLNTLKERIKRQIRILNAENDLITFDMIRREVESIFNISRPIDTKKQFEEAFNRFLEVMKNERRPRTIQKFETLLSHLKEFEKTKHYKLSFEKITPLFYEKFIAYLMNDLKHSNNTVGKYISIFDLPHIVVPMHKLVITHQALAY